MSTERIKMEEKHFFVVHTYISDEARRAHLSPPEKRDPHQQRVTEREWAEKASQGKHAKLMQKWIGNDFTASQRGFEQLNRSMIMRIPITYF